MLKIQKVKLFFPFLLLLCFEINAQSNVQFTRADALKEIKDTLLANRAAIISNQHWSPVLDIAFCFAHKNKFKLKQEVLNKLLDCYIQTRLIKSFGERQDKELDCVFEYLNTYQKDIIFFLRNTNKYIENPKFDYYKVFNVKE
jgi:hypothetical protein